MKTLLRHAPTGLFLQALNRWTGNREEALSFKSMSSAIEFAEQAGFTKMELAYLSNRNGEWATVPVAELRSIGSAKVR
jgi:hypothetical protein